MLTAKGGLSTAATAQVPGLAKTALFLHTNCSGLDDHHVLVKQLSRGQGALHKGGEHVESASKLFLLGWFDSLIVHHLLQARRLLGEEVAVCTELVHDLDIIPATKYGEATHKLVSGLGQSGDINRGRCDALAAKLEAKVGWFMHRAVCAMSP
eukprot:scaffold295495_cov35-Tisochrysis_lutea.AAC.2